MPDAAGRFKGISVPALPWLVASCTDCGTTPVVAARYERRGGEGTGSREYAVKVADLCQACHVGGEDDGAQ